MGAQRITTASAVSIAMVTLGQLGAVAVLMWVSPTIEAFFIWQAGVGLIHALVMLFGFAMAWNCGYLAISVWDYRLPTLWIFEGWKYVPATASGVLIVMFSIEHIIALAKSSEVEPAWG